MVASSVAVKPCLADVGPDAKSYFQSGSTSFGHVTSVPHPPTAKQTMTATVLEGHRAKKGLLAQGLVRQQQLLQGKECPTTAEERRMDQDLPTTRAGDQRFGWRGPDYQHAARRS